METPEKILADLLGTTEEYISKNAQSNPPYEGEYFVYIEAMKKYADTKVKNLVKPDVSGNEALRVVVCPVCDGRGKGYFGESFEQNYDACNGTGQTDR